MRIDREQFLWFAAAITGCHSGAQIGEPSVIVIAAPAPRAAQKPGSESELPEARDRGFDARCSRIAASGADADDDTGLRSCSVLAELCQHVADEFLPSVAEIAISCLEEQQGCSTCSSYSCVSAALEEVTPGEVRECELLGPSDEGSGSGYVVDLCKRYASGMNSMGRERFSLCLADNGYAVTSCLWYSGACGGGYPYPSYE